MSPNADKTAIIISTPLHKDGIEYNGNSSLYSLYKVFIEADFSLDLK